MQALVERAHQLGVVPAGQRMSMYKQFSRMGWRTREPFSEDLAVERPRLAEAITQTLKAKGFSPYDIAVLAGFAADDNNSMSKPAGRTLRAVLVDG